MAGGSPCIFSVADVLVGGTFVSRAVASMFILTVNPLKMLLMACKCTLPSRNFGSSCGKLKNEGAQIKARPYDEEVPCGGTALLMLASRCCGVENAVRFSEDLAFPANSRCFPWSRFLRRALLWMLDRIRKVTC
jgi:hypothetical protein